MERLPRLRKYLGTTQEPCELPAPAAAVSTGAGLKSSACRANVLMTVADKSSPLASISSTRQHSFFQVWPSTCSRTFHLQATWACTSERHSRRVSHSTSSPTRSSRRLLWEMSREAQERDTQGFPWQVHSAHFSFLLPGILTQFKPRRTQKLQGDAVTTPQSQISKDK